LELQPSLAVAVETVRLKMMVLLPETILMGALRQTNPLERDVYPKQTALLSYFQKKLKGSIFSKP